MSYVFIFKCDSLVGSLSLRGSLCLLNKPLISQAFPRLSWDNIVPLPFMSRPGTDFVGGFKM